MSACQECGNGRSTNWSKATADRLEANGLCFPCNFWQEKVAIKDEPNTVRVAGRHYTIGREGAPQSGHGGAKFVIKFHDGRIVETTNLWNQGVVPPRWVKRLPDNAEFLEKEEGKC